MAACHLLLLGEPMANTLGYHLVKSTYGQWLPGDGRGSWSAAWDDQIGFYEPHHLHPGDPVRQRMAAERMRHPAVRLGDDALRVVADTIAECAAESTWLVAACSIEPTHMHLQLTYSGRDIYATAKWLAQKITRAVHERTAHEGPVWCRGRWIGFIYDRATWGNTRRYIERHNERRGLGPRPHPFIIVPPM